MAESQREAISLALNSTKLNATNSLFREDPSLVFSIVTEERDQTLPGSLLARETLGTRLNIYPFSVGDGEVRLTGARLDSQRSQARFSATSTSVSAFL